MIDHIKLELLKKSNEEIIFNEKHTFLEDENLQKAATLCRDYARQHTLKIAQLVDDFIYKNLDTNVLETMKCKIENELLERKLKEQKCTK